MRARVRAERSFPADLSVLQAIRNFIRQRAAEAGIGAPAANDVVLAVSEACANAIRHTSSDEVRVSWLIHDDRLQIEVADQGIFKSRVPMPEIEDVGGHGIPLMMALMDEVSIRQGTTRQPGTVVRLVADLDALAERSGQAAS